MFNFFITNAYAMGLGPQSAGGQSQDVPFFANPLFMIAVMVAIFWFFIIAPQRKEQKKHQERLKNIQIGDKIITSGGIHGIVVNASGDPIKVKVADNVKLDISRSAVAVVTSGNEPVTEEKK